MFLVLNFSKLSKSIIFTHYPEKCGFVSKFPVKKGNNVEIKTKNPWNFNITLSSKRWETREC